jgi:hypothetical protein
MCDHQTNVPLHLLNIQLREWSVAMVAKGGAGIPEYILEDSLFMPSLSSLSSSARL